MTKNEIRNKRKRDAYEKTRKRAFKELKRTARSEKERHELYTEYDIRNRFMAEYEAF